MGDAEEARGAALGAPPRGGSGPTGSVRPRLLRGLRRALAACGLALLAAGCRRDFTVSRLGDVSVFAGVDTARNDAPVMLELLGLTDCPALPAGFTATLNGRPALPPASQMVDGGCPSRGLVFPRAALDGSMGGVNRFELKDATGAAVMEVVNFGRPHGFQLADPLVLPGRPLHYLHRGALAPSEVTAQWALPAAGAGLGQRQPAKVEVRGTMLEVSPPNAPADAPAVLELSWEEPVLVRACTGFGRCTVKTHYEQRIELKR